MGGKDSVTMPSAKKRPVLLPRKTYWHLYSLQGLAGDKLVQVVNKVLRGDFLLVK